MQRTWIQIQVGYRRNPSIDTTKKEMFELYFPVLCSFSFQRVCLFCFICRTEYCSLTHTWDSLLLLYFYISSSLPCFLPFSISHSPSLFLTLLSSLLRLKRASGAGACVNSFTHLHTQGHKIYRHSTQTCIHSHTHTHTH